MYNRAPANSHLGTSAAPPDDHEAPKILRGGEPSDGLAIPGLLV
jgi:hypothetical protein